jgi:pyruvate formate lyase activating enzyme
MTACAPVNRILRSSIVDGPGNRAVVFVQGCNFNCVYCHNPETICLCDSCGLCVAHCPAGALSHEENRVIWRRQKCALCDACIKACPRCSSPRVRSMKSGEVMEEIKPSLPFIRGITVSGGECTLYPSFLIELGKQSHANGKTFLLDSNGSYDFSSGGDLLDICDGVMLDIKAPPAGSEKVIGRSFDSFPQAEFLAGAGKLHEMRTVVSPGLFDAAPLVEEACRRVAPLSQRVRYKLIRYRPNGVRPGAARTLREPDDSLMETLAAICARHGLKPVVI